MEIKLQTKIHIFYHCYEKWNNICWYFQFQNQQKFFCAFCSCLCISWFCIFICHIFLLDQKTRRKKNKYKTTIEYPQNTHSYTTAKPQIDPEYRLWSTDSWFLSIKRLTFIHKIKIMNKKFFLVFWFLYIQKIYQTKDTR